MKKGGKTKTIGGLKDILECPNLKLDEQIMVEVVINQNTIRLNLNEFKQLLFREEKRPIIKNNISDIINNEEYKRKYGIEMIQEFVDYWTEMLPNGKKQRWQKQKAFDVNRRIIAWAKRDYNGLYKEHKFQLEKIRQDEYLREAEKKAIMTPEEQRRKIKEITGGLFKNVSKV
tara:strand:+ start:916 stop:1434 length:519 start_codon:yes stop_codon:yes gene_type:complete